MLDNKYVYVNIVRIGLADVIFVPGIPVQTIHYPVMRRIFNQVPRMVIVGQPNLGKACLERFELPLLEEWLSTVV